MTELLYREAEVAPAPAEAPPHTVTVRLCRWNAPRAVIDPDGSSYREQYPPDSLELAENVHVVDHHTGALIGRADPATLTAGDDGPTVELTIAETAAGRDALELVRSRVIRSVSMEVEPLEVERAGDLVTRTRSRVHGIAFAFRPQLDAPVLAVRSHERQPAMTDTDTAILRETPPPAAPAPDVAVNVVDAPTLDRAIEDLRRELLTRDDSAGAAGHPLTRFRSLDQFAEASWSDPALPALLNRALADQITTNNPGVIPPAWVQTVYGIVDQGRPTLSAFGVRSLPPSGMEVDWPYFDGDLKALVGEQLVQKTAVTSVRVDLKKGSTPLRTWAGASDLSYQLIRRSSPSYRDAYMRIMFAAYAAVTGGAAADAATSAAGAGNATLDLSTTVDHQAVAAMLFEASATVQAATGSPASFVTAATDVFVLLGGSLIPAPYGTVNQVGTATASTLTVNVSGLTVTHDPYLDSGKMVVSNGLAAGWYEDGPMTVTAEDVEKLGQNVAVWGMGAFGATIPAGIIVVTCTMPAITLAASSKSSK